MKHLNQRDVMGWNLLAHAPVQYVGPPWPRGEEPPVSGDEVENFYWRHPEATCSTRTAKALALIDRCRP